MRCLVSQHKIFAAITTIIIFKDINTEGSWLLLCPFLAREHFEHVALSPPTLFLSFFKGMS